MPNWCENNLTITGETKTMRELMRTIKENGDKLCETIMPMPRELKCMDTHKNVLVDEDDNWMVRDEWLDTDEEKEALEKTPTTIRSITPEELEMLKEKYLYADWYSWSAGIRGSKWSAEIDWNEREMEEWKDTDKEQSITLNYNTAWAPNVGVSRCLYENNEGITSIYHTYVEYGCDFVGTQEIIDGEVIDTATDGIPLEYHLTEYPDDWVKVNVRKKDKQVWADGKILGALIKENDKEVKCLTFMDAELLTFEKYKGDAYANEWVVDDYAFDYEDAKEQGIV